MKKKTKKTPISENLTLMDDFIAWLGSDEGQKSSEVIDVVLGFLEDAEADARCRKIIFSDGASLSIDQTAKRIYLETRIPFDAIQSNIISWLEMTYTPKNLNEAEMDQFEIDIDRWIKDYNRGKRPKLAAS